MHMLTLKTNGTLLYEYLPNGILNNLPGIGGDVQSINLVAVPVSSIIE